MEMLDCSCSHSSTDLFLVSSKTGCPQWHLETLFVQVLKEYDPIFGEEDLLEWSSPWQRSVVRAALRRGKRGSCPGNRITSSPSLSIVSPSSGLFSSPASTQSDVTLGMCITIDRSLGCEKLSRLQLYLICINLWYILSVFWKKLFQNEFSKTLFLW